MIEITQTLSDQALNGLPMTNNICLTLDIDWAPDFIIDFAADLLIDRDVRATWFMTHASPAIDRLRDHPDLFELGIHPNFQTGSTHGDTPEAVLDHCLSIVPEATSTRSHGLVQSSSLLRLLACEPSITVDVSLFLPGATGLQPIDYRLPEGALTRMPYFWEDDYEMIQRSPSWELEPLSFSPGLKIFDFHPFHIYLNGADFSSYDELKRRTGGNIQQAGPGDTDDLIRTGAGPRSLFEELLESMAGGGRHVRDFVGPLDGVKSETKENFEA